jgi:LysM repeat protein
MQTSLASFYRWLHRPEALMLALAAIALSSCTSSSPKIDGVPGNLPNVPLYGSARTPSHHMSRGDYPFDSNGNYVTSWAAEGGSAPGPSDSQRSRQPDRDDPPARRSSSKVTKMSSSPPKKVASSSTSTTKKASGSSSSSSTASKKTSSGGGGGGTTVTVKSSDTLYGLARKYGTTVAKIKAANGLKGDSIRDGAKLRIP